MKKRFFFPIKYGFWMFLGLSSMVSANSIKVSCIGNSITAAKKYVEHAEDILGSGFELIPRGAGGNTIGLHGERPFLKNNRMSKALEDQADIYTIMLGTNDSKPEEWQDGIKFREDYEVLIDTLATLPNDPTIILCLPSPSAVDGIANINGAVIKDSILPIIKAIAEDRGLPTIDFHTPLEAFPEFFPDGVHPNDDGHKRMGKVLASGLLRILGKPVQSIHVDKKTIQFQDGTPVPLKVELNLSNDEVLEITEFTDYKSTDSSVSRIDKTQAIRPMRGGNASIITSFLDFNDTVSIMVTEDNPVSFEVLPKGINLDLHSGIQVEAVLRNQYGTRMALPANIEWEQTGTGIFEEEKGLYFSGNNGETGKLNARVTDANYSPTSATYSFSNLPLLSRDGISQMFVMYSNHFNTIPLENDPFFEDEIEQLIPSPGSNFTKGEVPLEWKRDSTLEQNWWFYNESNSVSYMGFYVLCRDPRSLRFVYACNARMDIWQNGEHIHESDNSSKEKTSGSFDMPFGYSRFVIRLQHRKGETSLALRIVEASGDSLGELYDTFPGPSTVTVLPNSVIRNNMPDLTDNQVDLLGRKNRQFPVYWNSISNSTGQ